MQIKVNEIKEKNGNVTSDPTEVSNILNEFFINVGNSITKYIHHFPKLPIEYLVSRNSDSIILSPVTPSEVNEINLNLDSSKSVGPNSTAIKQSKVLGSKISFPLTKLVNQSSCNDIFPSKLKNS